MKTYQDTETKSWEWLKRQSYIPSSDAIGDGSKVGWELIEKYPVGKVKIPRNYPNPVDMRSVIEMIDSFHPFGFYPIRISNRGTLLDGQHRLKFAQLCGLKYVDVWVDDSTLS